MLEASGRVGSAAVVRDRDVLSAADVAMRDAQRDGLLPAVDHVLTVAGITLSGIDAVVCGEGPGSFTSLRVAAGLAKGIASAQGLPLLAVSSLALIAAAMPRAGRYLAVTDALRGEQFAAPFEVNAEHVRQLAPHRLVPADHVMEWARNLGASTAGPDVDGSLPRASSISRAGLTSSIVHAVDLASWEPVYGRLPAAQTRLTGDRTSSC